ncbi:Actin-related protein 2/3 complex subunit 2B [Vitis vinifera]|uniref:Arp2/3 complex 34 kDa subunit n=1 Tax=Vitis vinifera TaxID=29760 RepID=A0A438I014_VITVI|nr:Actin-related protein 2/3 complex subunit 2B [Vitis vinifera]
MACFERASPALKEILLKLYRIENVGARNQTGHNARYRIAHMGRYPVNRVPMIALWDEAVLFFHFGCTEKPVEIDHHLYEFGSVEYHIQSSASDPHDTYLSIATPLLSQGVLPSHGLSHYTIEMIKGICSDVLEIVEPAREGYQLTLRLDLAKIPQGKDGAKVIAQISSVQAVILSSQLKEMLQNVNSQDTSQGMYKPIKLVYHPREPFFVIRQPQKITAVFPMRFRENSDVIIATAFFQELMDVGSSEAWAKAPPCTWSPIPPPELRGELFEDLSTNGGFVSFDIFSHHVEGKQLDKTVWSLLNFYAYVKYHVKVLQNASMEEEEHIQKVEGMLQLMNLKR